MSIPHQCECDQCQDLRAELQASQAKAAAVRALVDEQAEDGGLWGVRLDGTQTIIEAHLQQELRRLHALIESDDAGRAFVDRVRAEALEEAAKAAEAFGVESRDRFVSDYGITPETSTKPFAGTKIAARIRALAREGGKS